MGGEEMAIEYFCAYHSYLDSMEELNDTERGRLFTACLIYSKTGEAPQLRGNERFVFPTLKAQIDRDKATYDSRCKKNSDNIRKRWNTDVYDGEQPCTNDTKTKEKEKTKEKAKDNYIPPSVVCGELPSSPPPAAVLPLVDGTDFEISVETVAELSGLYPAVDVAQQLRSMRGWLLANPKNRKTKAGIMRFVNSWLSREQNSARPAANQKPGGYTSGVDRLAEMYREEFGNG
jgi:hypothetical protein